MDIFFAVYEIFSIFVIENSTYYDEQSTERKLQSYQDGVCGTRENKPLVGRADWPSGESCLELSQRTCLQLLVKNQS